MDDYTIDIGGIEHVVQLSDEDALARGLKSAPKVAAKATRPAANKARTADTKGA